MYPHDSGRPDPPDPHLERITNALERIACAIEHEHKNEFAQILEAIQAVGRKIDDNVLDQAKIDMLTKKVQDNNQRLAGAVPPTKEG